MGGLVSTVAATESMAEHSNPLKSFTATRLPWAVALGMLVIYLGTLHSWISFASLPAVSDVGGWNDRSQSGAPLLYLLTLPLRILPTSVVPTAMNALAALFGALTLALLVRSVLLLPHDRTKEQRQREQSSHSLLSLRSNWVPALFAALVCGLQLSFWQHATAGTGEMLNVLLFAFVIRCLLEYRIYHKTTVADPCSARVRDRHHEQLGYGRIPAIVLCLPALDSSHAAVPRRPAAEAGVERPGWLIALFVAAGGRHDIRQRGELRGCTDGQPWSAEVVPREPV